MLRRGGMPELRARSTFSSEVVPLRENTTRYDVDEQSDVGYVTIERFFLQQNAPSRRQVARADEQTVAFRVIK